MTGLSYFPMKTEFFEAKAKKDRGPKLRARTKRGRVMRLWKSKYHSLLSLKGDIIS